MDVTALVVGGSSAIGSAVAAALAADGHRVRLWGRSRQRLAAACAAVGPDADTEIVDVTDRTALATAAAGLPALRVVVWAAGLFDWADADEADPAAWESVLDVNLVAAAAATRLLLPTLLRTAPSTLIYLGSAAGHTAYAHNAAYVASKHGLTGLARAVWLDVRDRDVKVSLISPGLVAAGAGLRAGAAVDALLAPADVAAAVRFVTGFPVRGCPTEIRLEPQRTP
ncbi:SDR family oxidoreductase [Nakamurella deserti]|uniref:SDR family oxidoreductase n=1 Tax=Nakamurella deserti TaxID=2164074 RepID=UPI000DBE05BF|nr:SDR family NAD(P)-dependent oxidoreductase [Nakamurella deserti]